MTSGILRRRGGPGFFGCVRPGGVNLEAWRRLPGCPRTDEAQREELQAGLQAGTLTFAAFEGGKGGPKPRSAGGL